MRILVTRITPTKSYTLNNRWYHPVKPRKTLFFIPPHEYQIKLWIQFFCVKKHRSFLYLHMVILRTRRFKVRHFRLKHRKNDLYEVMVPVNSYQKSIRYKTVRVTPVMRKIPFLETFFKRYRRIDSPFDPAVKYPYRNTLTY
jgi:hypothetical protein